MIVCTSLFGFQSPALVLIAIFRHLDKQTNKQQPKKEKPLCLCAWTKITKGGKLIPFANLSMTLKRSMCRLFSGEEGVRRGEIDSLCPHGPIRRPLFLRRQTVRSWFVSLSRIKIPFRLFVFMLVVSRVLNEQQQPTLTCQETLAKAR